MAVKLVFRVHALRRMFERQFSIDDIDAVIGSGETIEDYPDERPYPSRLVLGWRGARPMHVVVADNLSERVATVSAFLTVGSWSWGEAHGQSEYD